MEIKLLQNESDGKRWDDFVRECVFSTFYHQIGWKNIVEKSYQHKSYYLFAEENGQIIGILPLFLVKDVLWGKRLISLPFAPYGGICSRNGDAIEGLLTDARKLIVNLRAKYIELRYRAGDAVSARFTRNSQYITSLLKLSADPEIIWRQMNQKRRNTIRKAYKYSLTAEIDEKDEGVENFYSLYAHNMRELGTPVHSARFFREVKAEFPHSVRVIFVRYKGKIVASVFLLLFNNTIISAWAASLRDYLHCAPNDLLYWESIKYGCERSFEYFDFGRSLRGSGSARFKKEWGAKEVNLEYCYMLSNTDKTPLINSSNIKYERLSKIWRRLPLPLANRLGPMIRRSIV